MKDKVENEQTTESFADIFARRVNNSSEENMDNLTTSDEKEEDNLQEKVASSKEEDNKEVKQEEIKTDLTTEYELLKKQLTDAKTWGHKKNSAYVNAKKKITDFLSKLQEDSLINEEEASLALKAFDEQISEEDSHQEKKENSYANLKANLDKEFNIFKKYNKTSELDEKYQAFFGFFPLLPQDEQEKIVNYITNESPEVVIDHIITTGSEIYDTVYKGATKNGGIIPFVKSLHAQIEKLEKRNKELESELDTTEGTVHNRSINSKVLNLASHNNEKSFADIFRRV